MIPNLLTYGRIVAIFAIVACLFWPEDFYFRWLALVFYFFAASSDFFDGYLARIWGQQSALGRVFDPIADKSLVVATILMLVASGDIRSYSLIAAEIILIREIVVSGFREFLGERSAALPVTWLSKLKTVVQYVALGFLIASSAGDVLLPETWTLKIGISVLWIAALMTLYTGVHHCFIGIRETVALKEPSKEKERIDL